MSLTITRERAAMCARCKKVPVPAGRESYCTRKCQRHAARDEAREAGTHKVCVICTREFIAHDIRRTRCDNCQVIPVVTSVGVSARTGGTSGRCATTGGNAMAGRFTIDRVPDHGVSVHATMDDGREYILDIGAEYWEQRSTIGDFHANTAGRVAVKILANGELRVTLSIDGQSFMFEVWKIIGTGGAWPAHGVIDYLMLGKRSITPVTAKTVGPRSSTFVGVDGEGMSRECMECDCIQYVPMSDNPESPLAHICKTCGHREVSKPLELGAGHAHKYVLLGVGDEQIEDINGLGWEEIFEFLYAQFNKKRIYVGFFLGYDFNMWFKSLPPNKAVKLITSNGITSRQYVTKDGGKRFNPERIVGKRGTWEVHLHADRRLDIRRKICNCPGDSHLRKWCDQDNETCRNANCTRCRRGVKCPTTPWLHINDSGSFYQMSFIKVIDPTDWEKPVCTQAEYELIKAGKERRSTAALDDDMRMYNRLENRIFSVVMDRLRDGFTQCRIKLRSQNWYGPGQAAQAWFRSIDMPMMNHDVKRGETVIHRALKDIIPAGFTEAARKGYFGGWFEIMAHGIVPDTSYAYDLNSAYPATIATLPCLEHGKYSHSKPIQPRRDLPRLTAGQYRLIRASVWGSDEHIGTMLHRTDELSIMRPDNTRGWYWQREVEAGITAGIIDRVEVYEWHTYTPRDDCKPPAAGVANLYARRIREGKKSASGRAIKLIVNSLYGKTAQSIGEPPYANPIYASLITSGCRTSIIQSIASHKRGTAAVLMVATDGIFFDGPHDEIDTEVKRYVTEWNQSHGPNEQKSKDDRLGMWEGSTHERLTLFKPGVYWDQAARDAIKADEAPELKSRGVSSRDLAKVILAIDAEFESWDGELPTDKDGWPNTTFRLGFSMISCKQALQWTEDKMNYVIKTKNRIQVKRSKARKGIGQMPGNGAVDSFAFPDFAAWFDAAPTIGDVQNGTYTPETEGKTVSEIFQTRKEYDRQLEAAYKAAKVTTGDAQEMVMDAEYLAEDAKYRFWYLAGKVSEVEVTHSSYPGEKRGYADYYGQKTETAVRMPGKFDGRIYRSRPLNLKGGPNGMAQASKPYSQDMGTQYMVESGQWDSDHGGITPDGLAIAQLDMAMQWRG